MEEIDLNLATDSEGKGGVGGRGGREVGEGEGQVHRDRKEISGARI